MLALQTKMPNEATDGLAPSVLDSFPGAARAASHEFPPASEEDSRREPRVRTLNLLPRPGDPARGHYRFKRAEDGCSRRGHCRPTNVQRGYRRAGTVGFCHFSAQLERILVLFGEKSEERPKARYHGFGFASCSQGLVLPDGDIAGTNSNTAFDPSLKYPTHKVVLFWQPPFYVHHGPLRRLPWTTCHIILRSST